jgi:hypothetical protein
VDVWKVKEKLLVHIYIFYSTPHNPSPRYINRVFDLAHTEEGVSRMRFWVVFIGPIAHSTDGA